jgi:uncharacterized protein YchJ
MNSVWDDHGFGIVRRPKKLLNNGQQQVRAVYQTHLALRTIHRHLTALGKIYMSCRVIPHELTAEQAQLRVEFRCKLLQLPKDHHFISRIVTCDNKWFYLNNLDL